MAKKRDDETPRQFEALRSVVIADEKCFEPGSLVEFDVWGQ